MVRRFRRHLFGFFAGLCAISSQTAAHQIAASPGLVEAGAPPFVVLGPEAIGLASPPTDVRLMPDGRLLVVAARQVALGDGVRWQVFHQAPSDATVAGYGAAVDHDGLIYVGTPDGVARMDFGHDGFWRLTATAPWSPPDTTPRLTLQQSVVTPVGDEWYWHTITGAVIAWRPGKGARLAGYVDTFEHVFRLGGSLYFSERADGVLSRRAGTTVERIKAAGALSAITCAQPFDENHALVGTYGLGLQLFDGREVRHFSAPGVLSSGARINDLCTTDGGLFAAAVDNFGVVFFSRDGRTLQVLDRSLDQRLSRVKRLIPAAGGVVWGLLDGGVLRVEFPTRISQFEPLIGAGVTTVHPYRFDGRLWWLADGRIYRGDYGEDDRLTRLEIDGPANLFANSFSGAAGLPIVGTEDGAFFRGAIGWVAFAPGTKHLRVLDPTPVNGRWLYSALNEVGWLRRAGPAVVIDERIPVPELSNVFNNPVKDARGAIWLELGVGRVARVRLEQGKPLVENFSARDGLPLSWPQMFELEGAVGFNFSDGLFRFDDQLHRFVPDTSFVARLPGIKSVYGRPGLDAQGRLWIVADGAVQVFQRRDGRWSRLPLTVNPGFQPYYFTFEGGGVVWLHAQHRLARFDPAMPEAAPVPLRARITLVTLGGGNRSWFEVDRELPPLDYSENSVIVHFVASGNTFATPVTFELNLEGTGTDWVSNGSAGSAVFNRLKEGRYVLHVRPRSGAIVGSEATLAFSIRPPWHRTVPAYLAYAASALGLLWLSASLFSLLERRENARLERLVAERTAELNRSNAKLARQVEEIRQLNQAIDQSPVAVFLTLPDDTIEFANPRACALTGCASPDLIGRPMRQLRSDLVAPATLDEIAEVVRRGESWSGQLALRHADGHAVHVRSTISPIRSPDGQIRHRLVLEEDITDWLADQERSHQLEARLFQAQKMESVGTLAGGIAHDFNNILTGILGYCELTRFAAEGNLEVMEGLQQIHAAGLRAKDLVARILAFSRHTPSKRIPLDLSLPVAEALKLLRASTPATIELVQKLESGTVLADPTQIHQVVVNLCTNAIHAMRDRPGRLEVAIQSVTVDDRLAAEVPNLTPGPWLRLSVTDNGHGMDQGHLARIFDPFFTTKAQGEGTGLGLAIVQGVIASHGGALAVRSVPNQGTTFDLYFPFSTTIPAAPRSSATPPRGSGQEILVVDDESQVSTFAAVRLEQLGYRPTVFNDPRKALAAFTASPARFAAVVTDLTMPHLTGLDLLRQIRSLRPLTPVVILTGYGQEFTHERLDAISNCVVLQKPFSGEDLVEALNHLATTVSASRAAQRLALPV